MAKSKDDEAGFLRGLRVHPDRTGAEAVLGPLEARVVECLWELGRAAPVREIWERLEGGDELAYTTVLTVCARLHEKGVLVRTSVGRSHEYAVAATREGFVRGVARRLLEGLARQVRGTSAVGLLDELEPKDRRALARLLAELEGGGRE